jgi:hypothetical protein
MPTSRPSTRRSRADRHPRRNRRGGQGIQGVLRKGPGGDTYTISHSSTSYVYDTRGTLRLSLGHSLNAKECAEDLVTLMEIC